MIQVNVEEVMKQKGMIVEVSLTQQQVAEIIADYLYNHGFNAEQGSLKPVVHQEHDDSPTFEGYTFKVALNFTLPKKK